MSYMSKKKVFEYKKNSEITELAVDSHAHLDRFSNADDIISKMKDDGLAFIVLMAGDEGSANWNKDFCDTHKDLYFMYGIHPFDIDQFNEEKMRLFFEVNRDNKRLVGLGEIGLDYSRDRYEHTKKRQKEVFVSQIKIADDYGLPISVHIRDAHTDAIRILNENRSSLKHGGIIHCCSAEVGEVREYLSLGFHISFSGTITYGKKNSAYYLDETLKNVPLDKLLIETDCPFLCPAPYRGKTNEPKYVLVTAEKIAQILNLSVDEVIKITRENTKKLLKI